MTRLSFILVGREGRVQIEKSLEYEARDYPYARQRNISRWRARPYQGLPRLFEHMRAMSTFGDALDRYRDGGTSEV